MFRIAAVLICLSLIYCKQPLAPEAALNFKDSMIREHFKNIDSLEFYDTTNYNYQVLKAYFSDDTSFFDKMGKEIKIAKEQSRFGDMIDTCIQLKKISELEADEVYRFSHSESFCFYNQSVTICRKGNSISVHYLEYSYTDDGRIVEFRDKSGLKRVGPGCKIEREFNKELTLHDWNELEGKISDADYWGLREHNFSLGFDGASWRIDGYRKEPRYMTNQRIHSVYRWSPQNSFAELGKIFMKLAREKGMCGTFY